MITDLKEQQHLNVTEWPVHIKLILPLQKLLKMFLIKLEGIENEELTIFQYIEKMKNDGHEELEVQSCGFFFVSKSQGFLGDSLDGLVTDPSCKNPLGLVEVKNIKLKENENLVIALVRKGIFNKDGNINKSHQYYYQIQQQAFVADRTWCNFVVRGSSK